MAPKSPAQRISEEGWKRTTIVLKGYVMTGHIPAKQAEALRETWIEALTGEANIEAFVAGFTFADSRETLSYAQYVRLNLMDISVIIMPEEVEGDEE